MIVTGTLRPGSDQTRGGEKRTTLELTVTEAGASLLFATVTVTPTERTSGSAAGSGLLAGGAPPL